jgi:nicotinamide-nucleotide amidase
MAPLTRPIETAEILAVGSELLTPHRIDTNSLYLTAKLNDLGVAVKGKCVVGDDRHDLAGRLREALDRVDLVITTGGLGPTDDDLTREVAADVLRRAIVTDAAILATIEERFARRAARMPEINRRQAGVIAGAEVLGNDFGTAPGQLVEHEERVLVLLPGPPREMQPMFTSHVVPRIAARARGRRLYRRVIKVTGRSESQVEELAQPIYSQLSRPDLPVQATVLAAPGQIEIHLAAAGRDKAAIEARLDEGIHQLAQAIGSPVFSTDGRSLEAVIGDALRARGWRIAVAESCTGGLLGGRLTEIPGSSAWVVGGVIAYDNAVKIRELGVPESLIREQGAVSEPVARMMAEQVRIRFGADVGVAVSGVAGPGGGTLEKPVGTVCLAVATAHSVVRTLLFPGDREAIRRHATSAALDMVRRAIA